MNIPGSGRASELLGGLKDRITNSVHRDQDQEIFYDDAYAEYGDEAYSAHGDRGFQDSYQSVYDDAYYDEGYERYAPTPSDIESERLGVTTAPLVTSDDIRYGSYVTGTATSSQPVTQSALGRDLYNARDELRSTSGTTTTNVAVGNASGAREATVPLTGREFVSNYDDFVSPYQEKRESREQRTPLQEPATSTRSRGLDNLFSSTDATSSSQGATSAGTAVPSSAQLGASKGGREVHVVHPLRYNDVEQVAPLLKQGAIVVLVLKGTDADLAKRILDFSFGVASALDARVSCPADKTFIISSGADLSLEENHRLRQMGLV